MIKITPAQVRKKKDFIKDYSKAKNAADGSKLDANANIVSKNIATLESEIHKDINIQINRSLMCDEIENLFGKELSLEYLRQIKDHEIYVHDESSLKPYCSSISMYPYLLNGMKVLGGDSIAPKHIQSFCGGFINLIFAVSSQFAGAIGTPEFLMYLDYFARKDWDKDYLETHKNQLNELFQHIVYSINQPAAARGFQSVFWNISIFDKYFMEGMFSDFVFPDMEKPDFESISKLQEHFMNWICKEQEVALLTFPVITAAMVVDSEVGPKDEDFANLCAEQLAKGNTFFIYESESVDSLSSCCRLRNELTDNSFSYTLGAGGVSTGSLNVITINMNRLIQDNRDLKTEVEKVQKYQIAYRKLMEYYFKDGLLPVYSAGFVNMDKQYLTIGLNGFVEAAESIGLTPDNNYKYKKWVSKNLRVIFNANKKAKEKYGYMFNTEFVPAENLGAKNSSWDNSDGYEVNREVYNSYFYPVEDNKINILDKFILHGKELIQFLDGGSALHLNLDEYPSKEQYYEFFKIAAKTGCNYWTSNVKITICDDCGYIDKRTLKKCSKCESTNIGYATRIIGYRKRVDSFSSVRQKEEKLRYYHREN